MIEFLLGLIIGFVVAILLTTIGWAIYHAFKDERNLDGR